MTTISEARQKLAERQADSEELLEHNADLAAKAVGAERPAGMSAEEVIWRAQHGRLGVFEEKTPAPPPPAAPKPTCNSLDKLAARTAENLAKRQAKERESMAAYAGFVASEVDGKELNDKQVDQLTKLLEALDLSPQDFAADVTKLRQYRTYLASGEQGLVDRLEEEARVARQGIDDALAAVQTARQKSVAAGQAAADARSAQHTARDIRAKNPRLFANEEQA